MCSRCLLLLLVVLRTFKVVALAWQAILQAPSLRTWRWGAVNVIFSSPSEAPYKEMLPANLLNSSWLPSVGFLHAPIRCFYFSRDALMTFRYVKIYALYLFIFLIEIHE